MTYHDNQNNNGYSSLRLRHPSTCKESKELPPLKINSFVSDSTDNSTYCSSSSDSSETAKSEDKKLRDCSPPSSIMVLPTNFMEEQVFLWVVSIAVIAYVSLLILVYSVTSPERDWRVLNAGERSAVSFAATCLAISSLLLIIPSWVEPFVETKIKIPCQPSAVANKHGLTGVVLTAIAAEWIALVTNLIMAWCRHPVLLDPITHAPVYLVRWCEWIPLSALMTFMVEVLEHRVVKEDDCDECKVYTTTKHQSSKLFYWLRHLKKPFIFSLLQALSCTCALIFPFCKNASQWCFFMVISFLAFATIIPRCYEKYQRLQQTQFDAGSEEYLRLFYAYRLLKLCTFAWSTLVILYFVNCVCYRLLPPDHWVLESGLAMKVDTFFDVFSKSLYMKLIIEIHRSVYDPEARAYRRLRELRKLTSTIWQSSCDVICIGVQPSPTRCTALLSPSVFRLLDHEPPFMNCAILVEIEGTNKLKAVSYVYSDTFSVPPAVSNDFENHNFRLSLDSPIADRALKIVTASMQRQRRHRKTVSDGETNGFATPTLPTDKSFEDECSKSKKDGRLQSDRGRDCEVESNDETGIMKVHAIPRATHHGYNNNATITDSLRWCEFKISRRRNDSFVSIIRNVSERYRRAEAEQKAHILAESRHREAQSINRFTRHEVKNGLLAGIELVETLRVTVEGLCNNERVLHEQADSSRRVLDEMDSLLNGVLETVLAEAMTRDIIHEVYVPRLEKLDVLQVITSTNVKLGREEYPLLVEGCLPDLMMDPQLLRYVHMNAFSNACKYGGSGREVLTNLKYDERNNLFEMTVINEPGDGHGDLVKLGTKAAQRVFQQGTRLHVHNGIETDLERHRISSGDGAWVMQKCAKVLGGSCDISFLEDCTIFSFVCPAQSAAAVNTKDFKTPPGTWSVCIDDSHIQRRLMGKISSHLGVEESNQVVLGKDFSDCHEIKNRVQKILAEDDNCKILMLVDENLDYAHRHVSGSLIARGILDMLCPEQESRVLALVRSANDSAEDVALYSSRVHGFFPKAPMQREAVREILAPLWLERFSIHSDKKHHSCSSLNFDLQADKGSLSHDENLGSSEQICNATGKEPSLKKMWEVSKTRSRAK